MKLGSEVTVTLQWPDTKYISNSQDTSFFPADHNSGNVYRLADNFNFATSVLLGVDILLQLWKRISISTHLEL